MQPDLFLNVVHSIFEQAYTLVSDGQRDSVLEHRWDNDGDPFSTTRIDWTYDQENRLIEENRDEGDDDIVNGDDYTAAFKLGLTGNRLRKIQTGIESADIVYTYNDNDQLMAEGPDADSDHIPDPGTATVYAYDLNGSTIQKGDDDYGWDLRNRMVSATVDSQTVTYGYDSRGVRVSQSAGTATTLYLNDAENSTGYAKAIEEKASINAIPGRSFVFGHTVLAQADSDGSNVTVVYLLTDGHGSTRAVADESANVVEQYDYQAYGEAFGFTAIDPATGQTMLIAPAAALTHWLFGGDGIYDVSTGWTYHLARWRDGFRFVSYDSFEADHSSPIALHKFLYTPGNPSNNLDPSGHSFLGLTSVFSVRAIWVVGIAGILYGAFTVFKNLRVPSMSATAMTPSGTPAWASSVSPLTVINTDAVDAIDRLGSSSRGINCQQWAFNGGRGVSASLPSDAMAALQDGDGVGMMKAVDDWLERGTKDGIRGYRVSPNAAPGSSPSGWHVVALYAISNGFEKDFHWRTEDLRTGWSQKNERFVAGKADAPSPEGLPSVGFYWANQLIAVYRINTPPRNLP